MSFLGCRAPHGEQGRCGFPGALRSQRFLLCGRPRPLSAVHRVLFYGFPLGSSSHWVFLAWTLSLPQPLTTLGANLYLYLALPSTHHGWRFLNPPGARFTCPPQVFPWNLGLAYLALHTWKQIIYFGALHLSCDLFRPSLHIPGWEPADALWLPNTLHKYLLKKVGERAAAAASESRTLIELRGVVDLEEVAKILVTQRLRL